MTARKLPHTIKDRDAALQSLLSAVPGMVKQLKTLNADQKQAVLGIAALSHYAGVYAGSPLRPNATLLSNFYRDVGGISAASAARFRLGNIASACRAESIAYAASMARCLADGNKSERECEVQSAPEAAAEIACMLKQMESLKGILAKIFNRVP